MEKIPNIVRQRLVTQQPTGEHPETDLLTALAEQRLSGVERENVLAHLAACSTCREIVAIAADAAPQVTPVEEHLVAERRWWMIPAFQWGAAAAAVAMIAVGLLVLQPAQRREQLASNVRRDVPSGQSTSPSGRAAPSKEQDKAFVNQAPASPDRRARGLRPGEAPAFSDKAKQAPRASQPNSSPYFERLQQFSALQKDSAEADSTVPKREARVKPQVAGGLTTRAKSQDVQVSGAATAVQVQPSRGGIGSGSGAGIASSANEAPVITASNWASTAGSSTAPPAAAPQTPASSGTAQNTSQEVTLSASHAADELATGQAGPAVETHRAKSALSVKPAPATWRITNGRLQHFDGSRAAWDDVNVGGTSRLSIVTTLGPEVWVGGTDGSMFYSNDQGAHWIPTSTGGWSSDATITGMTPTARRSVEVYFSNGERWRSGDGGASWTRYQ